MIARILFLTLVCWHLLSVGSVFFLHYGTPFSVDIPFAADSTAIAIDSTFLVQDAERRCLAGVRHLRWNDFSGVGYDVQYSICAEDYASAKDNRERTRYYTTSDEALEIDYPALHAHDQAAMESVIKAYRRVITRQSFSDLEAAEMIVTSVQSIPYVLVHPHSCEHWRRQCRISGSLSQICRWHRKGRACAPSVDPIGVLSPVEFAYTLKGDCDTRTLFLYTVLNALDYDVVILNSDIRQHSVLGIALPGIRGRDQYRDRSAGKIYKVWETTSYGHRPGRYPGIFRQHEWYVAMR